jgi:hypothetical protein
MDRQLELYLYLSKVLTDGPGADDAVTSVPKATEITRM